MAVSALSKSGSNANRGWLSVKRSTSSWSNCSFVPKTFFSNTLPPMKPSSSEIGSRVKPSPFASKFRFTPCGITIGAVYSLKSVCSRASLLIRARKNPLSDNIGRRKSWSGTALTKPASALFARAFTMPDATVISHRSGRRLRLVSLVLSAFSSASISANTSPRQISDVPPRASRSNSFNFKIALGTSLGVSITTP